MLKLLLLLPPVLVLAYFSPSGQKPAPKPAGSAPAQQTIQVEPPRPAIKQIYTVDCAMCHGATGDGKTDLAKDMNLTLSDFTDPKTFEGKSDQQLFDIIRKGKDKMPPEDPPRAKDDEIRGLVKYIRSFSAGHTAPAEAPAAPPAATPAPAPAPAPNPSPSTN